MLGSYGDLCLCHVGFLQCVWFSCLSPRPTPTVLSAAPSRFLFECQDRWTDHHHHACARWRRRLRCQSLVENVTFASTVFLLASFLGAKTCCYSYEWNGREITKILLAQVLTPSSEAAWTNRVEQDWPLKQKRNANKGSNTKTSWAKYLGWTNKSGSTEATQSSTIARCQRTSVSNIRTNDSQAAGSPPWKWLRQKQKQRRNQRQEHLYHTTSNFVRDDVSKDEQGLNVGPLSETLTSAGIRTFPLLLEDRY